MRYTLYTASEIWELGLVAELPRSLGLKKVSATHLGFQAQLCFAIQVHRDGVMLPMLHSTL